MQIWRLIAHHRDPDAAIAAYRRHGKIAIGWTGIGDLRRSRPRDPAQLAALIKEKYFASKNWHMGGPSLWRLYREVEPGDLVILSDGSRRRHVMRVEGPYEWDVHGILEYGHWRRARTVSMDPDKLWRDGGSGVAEGENIRWTLCRCKQSVDA